jgi:hypothetical protein
VRRIGVALLLVGIVALVVAFDYLCLTAPIHPNLALEYKTLLANEVLADSTKGDFK